MFSIYIETTVFNRYLEEEREFCTETRSLFDKMQGGEIEAYTSVYVISELEKAQEPKRSRMLDLIREFHVHVLGSDDSAQELADVYIQAGVIPLRFRLDAVHIAVATVNNLDYVISLNFHHINKIKTKMVTEAINKVHGYSSPLICHPAEVL